MPDFDDELIGIVTRAIDAVADPTHFNTMSDMIVDRYNAGAFMIFTYDVAEHRTPGFRGSANLFDPEKISVIQMMMNGTADDDPRGYLDLLKGPPHVLRTEVEAHGVPSEDHLDFNAYRELSLKVSEGRCRTALKLNDTGPWLDLATLHPRERTADIPVRMRREMAFLSPIIAKSIETSRIVSALTSSYRLLLDLFDRLDFGAAFTDAEGRVTLSNATFRDMAADRDGLTEAGGVAGATDRASATRLRAALAAALSPNAKPADLTTTLTRRSGKLPLIARAAPIREDQVRKGDTLALLLVIDPEDETRISADGLAAFNLLTPAELDVVGHLVRGLPTEEIAERRSTTLETTRSQIKEATAKLACRSRLDLLRLAMATHVSARHPPSGG